MKQNKKEGKEKEEKRVRMIIPGWVLIVPELRHCKTVLWRLEEHQPLPHITQDSRL